MFTRKLLISLPIGISLLMGAGLHAQARSNADDDAHLLDESDCVPKMTEGMAREEARPFFEFLDKPQESVSSGIENLAQAIDEFFADEKVLYEKSGSFVQLTGDLLFEEPGQMHSIGDIKVRLRIPRTQKKLRLLLESDPDEQRSTVERVTNQTPRNDEADNNLYAGVQTELGKPEKWRIKPSLGLRIKFPVEYYVRVRASRTYLYDKWRLYLAQTPYWFDTTGFGFDANMEWSYPLRDDVLFRSLSILRYTDERDMFDYAQVFSLTHTLSSSRAITYEAAAFADAEPAVHTTQYLLLTRYRQRVHSDFLFLEIVPQLRFRKEFGFNDEASLLVRVEFLFQR